VNFAQGYPRYSPGEYTADVMLRRGEADACLLIGSEVLTRLCPEALEHLQQVPLLVLDGPCAETTVQPEVRFATAVYGIHLAGTAYRMDEVPIPLKPVLPARYPSDVDILTGIRQQVRA
jgi:formylmethanofuran dehydrogenase subunit B